MYIDHTAGGLPVELGRFSLPTHSKCSAERMLKENERLVVKATSAIRRQFPSDSDDLLQESRLALLAAHRDFDPTKGAGFRTFARHRLRGVVTSHLRKQKRHCRCCSLFDEVDLGTSGERCALIDVVIGEYPPADRALNIDIAAAKPLLRAFLPKLPKRQAEVIRLIYWEDLTLSQIAGQSGCTKQRVHAIAKKAVNFLRKQFVTEEFPIGGIGTPAYEQNNMSLQTEAQKWAQKKGS
jgi:RNA polymerase sigma factor (sigma-70 family)